MHSSIASAQSHLWFVLGDTPSRIMHLGLPYHSRSGMPPSKRHLGASSKLTLEYADSPDSELRQPTPELLIHYAWPYLDSGSIVSCCRAAPILSIYGKLRNSASRLTIDAIKSICTPLPHEVSASSISKQRASNIACILLLCDFNPGLMIRCLGGHYTSDFLDFATIDQSLAILSTLKQSKGQPSHDFHLLHHLFHNHVPFKATFRCNRNHTLSRHLYNNHRAADPHLPAICVKTAGDIQKS